MCARAIGQLSSSQSRSSILRETVKPSENQKKTGIPATQLVENVCMQKLEVKMAPRGQARMTLSSGLHATRRNALAAPSAPSLVGRVPNAALAVTSPNGSASAAVAASVGIGTLKTQAGRDTPARLVRTTISGQAPRVPRRGQVIHADLHLGTGVQHRRRRRRANPMLATCRECPRQRHTAVSPLWAACG